ncbi:hypothetical protein T484DRAFT_1755669 [Baffinella frigidus]|nr:hypothetical protein T484DRAFT_1755669 [Cryptophyta sp. CCMP2293]
MEETPFTVNKRHKFSDHGHQLDMISKDLKNASADKVEKFTGDAIHIVADVASGAVVVDAIVGAISLLSTSSKLTAAQVSDIVMRTTGILCTRDDVSSPHIHGLVTRIADDYVNVSCGLHCTQPGVNRDNNEPCDGFLCYYMKPCPCKPLENSSSKLVAPLFAGGVYLHASIDVCANNTIIRYDGDIMEGVDFDKLHPKDKRRKHAVKVGDEQRRVVPRMTCDKPHVSNFAARVRDCGKNGTANCQLWEDGREQLWLVALGERIYGGSELLIDFYDDGIEDAAEQTADTNFHP